MKYSKISESLYIKGRIGWKGLKKKEYLQEGSYRIINGSNIVDNKIDWSNCGYISKERYDESEEIKLKEGDILITKDGTIGKVAMVNKLDKPSTVASGLFILRNINLKKWDTLYLFYYLQSFKFKEFIHSRTSGSVIPHLYQRDFEELMIPELSLKKQKQISQKLHSIQQKIDLNNKINSNLLELTALLWKNKFSLYKETTTIESYGKIISGGTPSKKKSEYYIDGTISWITPKDLSNSDSLYIDRGALNITDIGLNQSSAKLLKKGTILYSSRAPIGYIAIAARELSTNQGFKSIQPYEQKYTEFLYHLMKFVTPNIINSASGSTFKEISMVGMKAIKVPKVSEKDIESYHFIVKPLFDKIRLVEQENIKLKKLKNTLLVKLLN